MATIEERSGSWRVSWRQGGRAGTKQSATFKDQPKANHAKRIVEAHKHNIDRWAVYHAVLGTPIPDTAPVQVKQPTVAEYAPVWLASRTRITPSTRARYRRQLDNEILPRIGHLRLDEMTGADIANLLNELRAGRKDTTVTRYYATTHSLFAFAHADKKIPDNPARRTDFVRDLVAHDDSGEENHVYLTTREFALILAAADERVRVLLRCLADTGARWSEITALDVRDVNLDGPSPSMRITKAWKQDEDGKWYRGSTKGRNRRTVPIPRRLVDALRRLVTGRAGDVLLFTAPMGGRLSHSNFRNRFWLPALAKASNCEEHQADTCECPTRLHPRPTIHDLRHSHVAWLIAGGLPLLAISRRLGHHTTAVTETVYGGILPEVNDAAIAILDGMDDPELSAVASKPRQLRRGRVAPRHRRTLASRRV